MIWEPRRRWNLEWQSTWREGQSKGEKCWKRGMKKRRGESDCKRKYTSPYPLPKAGTGFVFWLYMIRQISKKEKFLLLKKIFPSLNIIFIKKKWHFILVTIAKVKIPENEHDSLGSILGEMKPWVLLIMI